MVDVDKALEQPKDKAEAFTTLLSGLATALSVQLDLDNRHLGVKEAKEAELNYRVAVLIDGDPKLPQWKAATYATQPGMDEAGGDLTWDDYCKETRDLRHAAAIARANVKLAEAALSAFLTDGIYAEAPILRIDAPPLGVDANALVSELMADLCDIPAIETAFTMVPDEKQTALLNRMETTIKEHLG